MVQASFPVIFRPLIFTVKSAHHTPKNNTGMAKLFGHVFSSAEVIR